MAVATAAPMATAATVIALRRGDRRIDWLTKRRNMVLGGIPENPGAGHQVVGGNHHAVALHLGSDRYRIASAVRADARNENRRGAVLADDVGALLIVALVAA